MASIQVDKYLQGSDLISYSARQNHFLFSGMKRNTGADYSTAHLEVVAERVGKIVKKGSIYYPAAKAGAWWHDGPEDIAGLDVYDPYQPKGDLKKGMVYLNDLLLDAGEAGMWTAFIVNLVTHREKKERYFDYVNKIFSFPALPLQRDLHALAGIIKGVDIRYNTNPDEKINFDKVLAEYASRKSGTEKDLVDFYRRTKVIDAFEERKDYSYDPALFEEQLRQRAKHKLQARSIDNLGWYLPLADQRLLEGWPKENSLFDWNEMRALLKEAYIDSLRAFPLDVHSVKMFGFNHRAAKVPGYKSVRREIREEMASGKLKIVKIS